MRENDPLPLMNSAPTRRSTEARVCVERRFVCSRGKAIHKHTEWLVMNMASVTAEFSIISTGGASRCWII